MEKIYIKILIPFSSSQSQSEDTGGEGKYYKRTQEPWTDFHQFKDPEETAPLLKDMQFLQMLSDPRKMKT